MNFKMKEQNAPRTLEIVKRKKKKKKQNKPMPNVDCGMV